MNQLKPGRPPKEGGPFSARFDLRLTPEQHQKLLQLGGNEWVREMIAKAPNKKPPVS